MKKRIIASILIALVLCLNINTVYAETLTKEQWQKVSKDWTQVSLNVGRNETEMNFSWYSHDGQKQTFFYGTKADLSDKKEANISQSNAQEGYKSNRVTITDLKENTTYYYQISGKKIESFNTQNTKSFQFIVVGDPQIGCSNISEDFDEYIKAGYEADFNDSNGWANTLSQAMKKTNNKASFIISAGDQTNNEFEEFDNVEFSEMEYSGFLAPSILRSIPIATTVGNHDATNPNYLYHFNLPNMSNLGKHEISGGDYYFTYGQALFMVLNVQGTDVDEHKQFIKETVQANSNCKWRFVTLHQDIYGSGEHSNEPEVVNLRYALQGTFEENHIDVVFSGHDHTYSRSHFLKSKGNAKEVPFTDGEFYDLFQIDAIGSESDGKPYISSANIEEDTTDLVQKKYLSYINTIMDSEAVVEETKGKQIVNNPNGVLYITTNSASGSHFYEMVAREQSYIAARWQENIPTYTVIDINDSTLTINTYRADTNETIDKELQIVKNEKQSFVNENKYIPLYICVTVVIGLIVLSSIVLIKKKRTLS